MSVRKTLFSGTLYIAIAKYSGLALQVFLSAILARLISPKDFGIIAIASVFIVFIEVVSNFGISPAIVQNKELSKQDLNSIFSYTVYSSFIVTLLFFSCSWVIAYFYGYKELLAICQLLSIKVFFTVLNFVPQALLLKNKEFKFIAIVTFVLQILTGVVSVIAAYKGFGIYSLLISPIITSIVLFFFSYYKYPLEVVWRPSVQSVKKIFEFSIFQFMSNLLNFFTKNLDKLLLGKYLGMALLGFYEKSYRLMLLPVQNITHVITPVMHPVFSDLQNRLKELGEKYLKIIKLLAYLSFPLSVYLAFNAKELITIVYGDTWKPAIPVFRIFSISVGFQVLASSTGAIFQSANATRLMFFRELFSVVVVFIALMISLLVFRDVNVVAWSYVIAVIISFIQCFYVLFSRLGIRLAAALKSLYFPITLSVLLLAMLFITDVFMDNKNVFLSLAVKSIVSLVLVLGFLFIFNIYNIKYSLKDFNKKIFLTVFSRTKFQND